METTTAIIISTRGFGVFRPELLLAPEAVRLVGVFSEPDAANLTSVQRGWFDELHVVPCALAQPSDMLSSLLDEAAAREVMRQVRQTAPAGAVSLHCYDEQNMLVAAALRDEFDLIGPGFAAIEPFRDKLVMKQRCATAGVRVPRFGRYRPELAQDSRAYFDRIVAEVGLPFVLKPVGAAGGDGVCYVQSLAEFDAVAGNFGRDYEYEEFIEGTMYSVNILSSGGKTIFGGVTEYLVNSIEVQHGRVNADINLIDHDPRVNRMVSFADAVLDALGRPDGPSHLELFLTPAGELVFLEVAARFKGLAGLAAMQLHYGIAFVNVALEIEAGIRSRPYDGEQIYCFDAVVPKQRGIIAELREPDLHSDYEISWKVRPGDRIEQSSSLIANGGTLLIRNHDYETLYEDFRRLAHYVPVRYKAENQRTDAAGRG